MAGRTALLVVHGIGAQSPGDTVDKLLNGLRSAGASTVVGPRGERPIVTVGGQPVHLYEVYWADVLKGEVTHETFLMNELQSLSWFPWLNLRCGLYRGCRYSTIKLAWWCVALPIVNFLVLFAYYGAGMLAQIFSGSTGTRAKEAGESDARRAARKAFGQGTTLTIVDRMLDEYAGDVFSYVNSAGDAFYRDTGEPEVPPQVAQAYRSIVERFYDQLVAADRDGCDTIQIVAHSLGTVVTYHALSGFGGELLRTDAHAIRAAKAKVTHVYTIGSPLEKIRFFWPRLAPRGAGDRDIAFRWDNFVSFFDPVSGMITSFDDWGPVANHRLVGGGFFLGHVVYERSPVFLGALTAGLCGHVLPLQRGFRQRLRDALMLTGEMLAEPIAMAIVLTLGAALFVLVALLLPYLLSWVLRLFLPDAARIHATNMMSLISGALMILAFSIAPKIRAGKAHARYWAAAPHAASRQETL